MPNAQQQTIRTCAATVESYDAETGELVLEWQTGSEMLRRDPYSGERWIEQLVVSEEAIDMSRLDEHAPLLDSHRPYSLADVIGVVVPGSTEIADGKVRSRVRLSQAEADADRVQKVVDGIARNVSVGYDPLAVEITEPSSEQALKKELVTRWQPFELSMVPMGADPLAHSASLHDLQPQTQPGTAPGETRSKEPEDQIMPNKAPKTDAAPDGAAQADVNVTVTMDVDGHEQHAETARAAAITDLAERHGFPMKWATAHIKAGTPLDGSDGVRADILKTKADESDRSAGSNAVHVDMGATDHSKRMAAMESYLMHRIDPEQNELTEDAQRFASFTVVELMRHDYQARGVNRRWASRMALVGDCLRKRYLGGLHGTDDFPLVLENVMNKTLRQAYELAPKTYQQWTTRATAQDFKEISRVQLGQAPELLPVNEHGEFKRGTVGESAEKYHLQTFGRVVGLSRQAMVNDDLSAFGRIARGFAWSAAELEQETVYGILTANPLMSDGVALFDATDHSNDIASGSGGPASVAELNDMRLLLRTQSGIDGRGRVRSVPRYVIAPEAQRTAWEQLLGNLFVPTVPDEAVPASMRTLELITDPILDDASALVWYLTADPASMDTIEYAYLSGAEGLYTETRVGFDVDGAETKARLDFAAKALDWRGMARNAGA